mgnify:CR=1 FL=1
MNYILFDIECYQNYFLVSFRSNRGRKVSFEMFDGQPLDTGGLRRVIESGIELVSFNGANYDVPMIRLALTGADCAALKAMSNDIIESDIKPWDAERKYALPPIQINHIDLKEVAPGTTRGSARRERSARGAAAVLRERS